jgi:hypothetical protein
LGSLPHLLQRGGSELTSTAAFSISFDSLRLSTSPADAFPARRTLCYHSSPSCIMLLVEFEATPFAASYRHAVAPRKWTAAIVQWFKITERFEFEGFFD